MMELSPDRRLDLAEVLRDLDAYRPRRRGWTWRRHVPHHRVGPFVLEDTSEPLTRSVPLPAAEAFEDIDPQCDVVITTEIASGRFEDDLRRMRMAAWHGADHLMVIRTTGQSHIDGLLEGTPEGVGGIPITRKQLRATRKALDAIEDEVGRPINLHSYVSGLAGPEIAVLFFEEGVNGAHQDPQYNVLYRNINAHRSFVDAAEAKTVMAAAGILQIDGAHNANATAKEAWKVTPELLVQHGINTAYSRAVGMPAGQIALSTVPPTAPPAPKLRLDLPYAVALRRLFADYRFRAQQNTRYIESDTREATVTHVLDTLISRLTSADIQSTITPDEGRNIPWHYNNVAGSETARQTLMGLDGLSEMVRLRDDGCLPETAREIEERAVLFLEEIIELGGYFAAAEAGMFVDSGYFPERSGDGISRDPTGGSGAGTLVRREPDYGAPVCRHFGQNSYGRDGQDACAPIGGCTLCDPTKIVYIDELDPDDNVEQRLEQPRAETAEGLIRPEVEKAGDGVVCVTLFVPAQPDIAEAAALEMARHMGLEDPRVISRRVMHPAEGSVFEVRGVFPHAMQIGALPRDEQVVPLSHEEIEAFVRPRGIHVVAATLGEDEHSVGLREILDIKHGGIERYGFRCHPLGTSVPVERLLDAAIEHEAQVVLASTIVTHLDVHLENMTKLHELAVERGVRDEMLLIGGGTQVTDGAARACGLDAGFGRGTKGQEVGSFAVRALRSELASEATDRMEDSSRREGSGAQAERPISSSPVGPGVTAKLPYVEIDVLAVERNARAIVQLCSAGGIAVTGVTKGVFGHPEVARAMLRGGVTSIGESRLDNIARLRAGGIDTAVMLMRPPSLASAAEAVDGVAVSLQSDLVTLERMGAAAGATGGVHDVILMVDLGERREGVLPDDLPRFAHAAVASPGIRVVGIGTNLTCLAGIIPTVDNMNRLVELAEQVERRCGVELTWISAGSSSALPLLAEGSMPDRVDNLRIGEAILLGRETVHHQPWPGTVQDAVLLRAEVVEVKDKPAPPPGPRADRTFEHAPSPDLTGGRRALVALGRADVDTDGLTPLDTGHRLLGATSDYLVVDVSRDAEPVAVGDTVAYALDYSALVTAMASIGVDTHLVVGRSPRSFTRGLHEPDLVAPPRER